MASRLRGTPRPYAEARPSITGTAAQGNVLTCNDGVWIPQPITITRQWIRDASTVIAAPTGRDLYVWPLLMRPIPSNAASPAPMPMTQRRSTPPARQRWPDAHPRPADPVHRRDAQEP